MSFLKDTTDRGHPNPKIALNDQTYAKDLHWYAVIMGSAVST